jgi:hypothetical protein
MTLTERLEDGYVLGITHYNNSYRAYVAPSAWFVMDYKAYDPSITASQQRTNDFRNGVIVVDLDTADAYLSAMEPDLLPMDELRNALPANGDQLQPLFLIDFETRQYISWYFDIGYEDYIPSGWKGVFDNPINYLPEPIRQIWL